MSIFSQYFAVGESVPNNQVNMFPTGLTGKSIVHSLNAKKLTDKSLGTIPTDLETRLGNNCEIAGNNRVCNY